MFPHEKEKENKPILSMRMERGDYFIVRSQGLNGG